MLAPVGFEDVSARFAMGGFALYVVLVSLLRLLRDDEFPRLTAMKRIWGRVQGLVLYFTSQVAVPLILAIVFIASGFSALGPSSGYDVVPHWHVHQHLLSRHGAPPPQISAILPSEQIYPLLLMP
ncbi:MAG: hypothetical protein C0621_03175 [Desulfuromonas sp.]|nr:MAG: hypothetical protein C0621_03175 [Desulfuromonas sp.]